MIYIFTGQTASGKTTLKHLISKSMRLEANTAYTTRPMRDGEVDGVDYHFITRKAFDENSNDFVCKRTYATIHGDWTYGIKLSEILDGKNYAIILDALGAKQLKALMSDKVIIIYVDVPEQVRKFRAYHREKKTFDPEIERRFEADKKDFKNFENVADFVVCNLDKQEALMQIENLIQETI